MGMKIIAAGSSADAPCSGIMIGALTVGSAVPHAVNALGRVPWRGVVLLGNAQALLGALLRSPVRRPFAMPQSRFDPAQILEIVRNRPLRLANWAISEHVELYHVGMDCRDLLGFTSGKALDV